MSAFVGQGSPYRHRYGLMPGDPAVADIETQLTAQPPVLGLAISIYGEVDGVGADAPHHAQKFTGPHTNTAFFALQGIICLRGPLEWARAVLKARALAISQ